MICPFQPSFFGLTDGYSESVYEQIFNLKYHGGWGFIEAYNLPIMLREWFVKRLVKQFEEGGGVLGLLGEAVNATTEQLSRANKAIIDFELEGYRFPRAS